MRFHLVLDGRDSCCWKCRRIKPNVILEVKGDKRHEARSKRKERKERKRGREERKSEDVEWGWGGGGGEGGIIILQTVGTQRSSPLGEPRKKIQIVPRVQRLTQHQ